MDNALLEKLNTYLISKGKPPKELVQNFVKSNASNVKKLSVQNRNVIKSKPAKIKDGKKVASKLCPADLKPSTERIRKTKNFVVSSTAKENVKQSDLKLRKPTTPYKSKATKKGIGSLRKAKSRPATPQINKDGKSARPSLAVVATKKLVRRSMISCQNAVKLSSDNNVITESVKSRKNFTTPKQGIKRKLDVHTEKIVRRKMSVSSCQKRSKTPKPKQFGSEEEKMKRLEQLRSWMISKGKDPTKLCGFTPAKCVLTPVNSPAKDNINTDQSSQWPSLREQDYCNELSVLVNQTMKEAQLCLEKDCSLTDVLTQLLQFKEKVPVCENNASYWLTLAMVYQKLNKDEKEIRSLYEKAIEIKAEPISDVKNALKEFLEMQETQPQKIPTPVSDEKPSPIQEMPSSPKVNTNPSSGFTHNVAFNAPLHHRPQFSKPIPLSPLVTAERPSSVIKLRMVPKSSPIFKKIIARKALPADVNGIVTPVRRSKRIENSKWSYPKGLLSQERCVTNALDLVEAAGSSENMSEDFVFDQNVALGDEYSDIQKVLQF